MTPTKTRTTMLYSKQSLEQALSDIKNGTPVRTAARKYGIPKTTLLYKSRGDLPVDCRKGPATNLTAEEENILVQWLLFIGEKGFPATKLQLLDSVEMLIKSTKRSTSFINNRPGKKWYVSFMKRHPIVAERISQNLTAARAAVSEKAIRSWFEEIKLYVNREGLEDIWNDSKRIFNADETSFLLSPKGQKVLVRKGESTVYNHITGDEKENLTTLININAAGMVVPPMVIFKYERIPPHVSNLMPNEWGIGKSESGWMTGPTFYEYVTNIFYPWLVKNKIPFPIAFFVDGHKSHMTMALSQFCSEKRIILISLYPNATHILQPLDVAVFRPLKHSWKNSVKKWKIDNNGAKFKKEHFAGVLQDAINVSVSPETIANGFRCTGLYPLNADAIDYTKYFKISENNTNRESFHEDQEVNKSFLKFMEKNLDETTVGEFNNSDEVWKGSPEKEALFNFWKRMSEKVKNLDGDNYEQSGGDEVQTLNENEPINKDGAKRRTINEENDSGTQTTAQSRTPPNKIDSNNFPGMCTPLPLQQNDENKDINNLPTTSHDVSASSPVTNIPFMVPTPFKKCLFWPVSPVNSKSKRSKEKIPSVAVSQEWKAYHEKKLQKKEQEEREKEERKRKRDEKKAMKVEKNKKAKKKSKVAKDESSSESSIELNIESEGEGDDWMESQSEDGNENPTITNINVNEYVIVKYDSAYYPGKVVKKRSNDFLISVMSGGGILNNWKWPFPKDEMWYSVDDIVQIIREPTAINKRGSFRVPELEKYNTYYMP